MDGRKLGINIFIFSVVSILCLILAEILLGAFYSQTESKEVLRGNTSTFHPIVGWTGYRNATVRMTTSEFRVVHSTNSRGFYDREWSQESNKTRIAFIGDSFVEGTHVEEGERFSDLVQDKLGAEFEVMNFGISGYGTCNEYLALKHIAAEYDPDVVVLFFYTGNDFYDNTDTWKKRPYCVFDGGEYVSYVPPQPTQSEGFSLVSAVEQTNLGMLFLNAIRYSKISFYLGSILRGEEPSYGRTRVFDMRRRQENHELYNRSILLVEEMQKYVQQQDASFYLVLIPDIMQAEEDVWISIRDKYNYNDTNFNFTYPHDYLKTRIDAPTLDLLPVLRDDPAMLYYVQNRHFNAQGHVVVAQALTDFLDE